MDALRIPGQEQAIRKQQLEGQINVLNEQILAGTQNEEHYKGRIQTIEAELSVRTDSKKKLEEEKTDIYAQLKAVRKKLSEEEEKLRTAQENMEACTLEVENGKNEIIEILNSRANVKGKAQRFDAMMEQAEIRKAEISQRILRLKSEEEEQQTILTTARKQYDEITSQIENANEECEHLNLSVMKIQEKLKEQNTKLEAEQTAYHREASRLDSLRNIAERYDGYGNSIRRVMEQKERVPGIQGVVADLIQVNKDYEIAIETALGGSIQNIVTDNEDTAKKMISFLKTNKFGRATFLPLTSMRGGGGIRNEEALKEPGVIGTADKLVYVEARFTGLAEQLLGRTLVVRTIDDGILIARKYKQSIRLVTLEGELINPGGSMTGGAFKNSSNLLSRRREIEEFEKTVAMLKKDMDAAEADVSRIKSERAGCYNMVDDIRQELRKASVIENTAKMNAEQTKTRMEEAKQSCAGYVAEQGKLERELGEIIENEESIRMELEVSENLEKELNLRIEELHALLEKERDTESEQLKISEESHLSLAGMEQQNLFVSENISRIEEEIVKFQAELEELDKNKDYASDEIKEKEDKIKELRGTIDNSRELFDEIEKEIKEQTEGRDALNRKHKQFLQMREDLSKHISALDKECFRLDSQKQSYEAASEKQMNYMWEEYEITYNHAMKLRDENLTDLAYMKRQIQELKNEIRKLGTVNVNAIEDFKNISERYAFLKNQHDDLVEAEQTLMQIIDELDAAMRKQFAEQFLKIKEEFNTVFRQLFGGGKGTLELMEDEDILEAGIRIIAQPPGKKLQNMMQLSGGEKALTAISLLFAIQNLKPSPFCLLDEIEAALDDNNVTRFAQYLHKLTKNTQFIVITHRRGTMTAADRLYGITMQEKGVSTLVSVDLLEDKLDR